MTNRTLAAVLVAFLSGCMENDQPPGGEDLGPDPDSPRVLDGLQVLYTFEEGTGLDVKDRSGVEPAFDLHLDNLVTNKWLPDRGVEIVGPSVITSLEVAGKVFASCVQANAVTIETWVEPANIDQQGTLFSYSKQGQRNVRLAVDTTRYVGQVLTARPDPMLADAVITNMETVDTPDNIAALTAQHVVYTRDVTGAAVYVNGVDTKPPSMSTTPSDPPPPTDQTEWSPTYQLAIGNEGSGGSPWLGRVYMAAVYCRKLSAAEVQKNYGAGY